MRIQGRLLRPSTLAERRVMFSLGLPAIIRVPRSENPFSVARRLRRLALHLSADADQLRRLARKVARSPVPPQLPDSRSDEDAAV